MGGEEKPEKKSNEQGRLLCGERVWTGRRGEENMYEQGGG